MNNSKDLDSISIQSWHCLRKQSPDIKIRFKNDSFNPNGGIGIPRYKTLKGYSITIGSKSQRFKISSCISSDNILVYLYSPVDKVNSINLNDISHESRFNLETWNWSN